MARVGSFWIKVRFKAVHRIGMALLIVASLVQSTPFMINDDCSEANLQTKNPVCFEAYHSNVGGPDGSWVIMGVAQMFFFHVLFIVSTLPAAVSQAKGSPGRGC